MKTRYVSIDIETTGLDPGTSQVLEFAAVIEDWTSPVESLPSLRLLVDHGAITGHPFALTMNARLIAELCRPNPSDRAPFGPDWPGGSERVTPDQVGPAFTAFLSRHLPGVTPTLAGKNAATFDIPFLSRLPNWPRCRHRVVDVGTLWWWPETDEALPDTAACLTRSGVTNDNLHSALADCRAVIGMVRARFPGPA